MIAAGAGTVALGAGLSRYGRRHTARLIECPAQLMDQSFALFLRPFAARGARADDQTYRRALRRGIWHGLRCREAALGFYAAAPVSAVVAERSRSATVLVSG